jgi:arsenate reductase (thioredoxin)
VSPPKIHSKKTRKSKTRNLKRRSANARQAAWDFPAAPDFAFALVSGEIKNAIAARNVTMPRNVLFLCTGNSARSILAEAILNQKGRPNFTAYSAGSHPTGRVNPYAIKQLEMAKLPVSDLRSKNWDEFAKPDAPKMDFVFTVCDSAANEICPVWPGQPITAHWGVPDPAAEAGSTEQIERAFRDAFVTLHRRIGLFLSLPISSLDRLSVKKELDRIGKQ